MAPCTAKWKGSDGPEPKSYKEQFEWVSGPLIIFIKICRVGFADGPDPISIKKEPISISGPQRLVLCAPYPDLINYKEQLKGISGPMTHFHSNPPIRVRRWAGPDINQKGAYNAFRVCEVHRSSEALWFGIRRSPI